MTQLLLIMATQSLSKDHFSLKITSELGMVVRSQYLGDEAGGLSRVQGQLELHCEYRKPGLYMTLSQKIQGMGNNTHAE